MGFVRLQNKAYYRKSTLVRDLEVIVKGAFGRGMEVADLPNDMGKTAFGDFGDIEVSKDPRPQEMVRVISSNQQAPRRITLLQDDTFFRWRFAKRWGRTK